MIKTCSAGIALKRSHDHMHARYVSTGGMAVVVLPISCLALWSGSWGVSLFFIGILTCLLGLNRLIERVSPDTVAVLYNDRIKVFVTNTISCVFSWSEIEEVHWPSRCDDDSKIMLWLIKCNKAPQGFTDISLSYLCANDKLTLIRCIRLATQHLEQVRWPSFCRHVAVPLAERLPRNEEETFTANHYRAMRSSERAYALLKGVKLSLMTPYFMARLVSRKTWWTVATLVGISGVINIRMIWGEWVEPFASYTYGSTLVFFLLGFASPWDVSTNECKERMSDLHGVLNFGILLIGGPLFVIALDLNCVWLPENLREFIAFVFILLYLSPPIAWMISDHRIEKRDGPALDAAAMRRWEEYEETGVLPPDTTKCLGSE